MMSLLFNMLSRWVRAFLQEGEGEVAQSCLTFCDPVDCNLLGFSVHGILQARILEWIAISFIHESKRLLISRLQSPSAVVLEPRRITRYPSPNPSNLSVQERWVHSVVQEGPPEKEMAAHSSILAWRIPWTEEPGGLQSTGSQRVGHDSVTSLSLS